MKRMIYLSFGTLVTIIRLEKKIISLIKQVIEVLKKIPPKVQINISDIEIHQFNNTVNSDKDL